VEKKKILRSIDDYMLAGVCGGLADYFDIDSSLVRIIFVLLILCGGGGILIYFVLWLVIPKKEGKERKINRKEKMEEFADDIKDKAKSMTKEIILDTKIKKSTKKINVLGVVLILVGLVAIWNQISPIIIDWDLFWPGLLVLIGILFLIK